MIYSITQGQPYFRSMKAAADYYGKGFATCGACGADLGSGMDAALSKVQAGEIHIGQPERADDEIRRWWDQDGRLTIQYHAHALPEVG